MRFQEVIVTPGASTFVTNDVEQGKANGIADEKEDSGNEAGNFNLHGGQIRQGRFSLCALAKS